MDDQSKVGAVGVEGIIDSVAIAEASGGMVDLGTWTALEAATCECYAEARARIEQNFGRAPGSSSLAARARRKA